MKQMRKGDCLLICYLIWYVHMRANPCLCLIWFLRLMPSDTCYVLSFAIIMLNTSLHNPNVRDKPPVERFISMNRGINEGGDLPEELLRVTLLVQWLCVCLCVCVMIDLWSFCQIHSAQRRAFPPLFRFMYFYFSPPPVCRTFTTASKMSPSKSQRTTGTIWRTRSSTPIEKAGS